MFDENQKHEKEKLDMQNSFKQITEAEYKSQYAILDAQAKTFREKQKAQAIEAIRNNNLTKILSQIETNTSKAYDDELAKFTDNEREKNRVEIEMQQQNLSSKKAALKKELDERRISQEEYNREIYKDEANLRALQSQQNQVHCNGGSVSEGLTIYDILRNSGRNIYMNVEGSCHSMSVVLLLAAPLENRTGNVNLRALVHRVYAPMYGYYTADELKSLSEDIVREENAILDIYVERTGKNRASLSAWMKSEKERTAEELLNMNFISKINSYNTNSKKASMKKNSKPAGKQTGNKAQNALQKATAFLNRLGNLLNSDLVNFDYKDAEGNIVFSTEAEEDTLAVGDAVIVIPYLG
jgi:ATP-dependent protease ClpP protease subunit